MFGHRAAGKRAAAHIIIGCATLGVGIEGAKSLVAQGGFGRVMAGRCAILITSRFVLGHIRDNLLSSPG